MRTTKAQLEGMIEMIRNRHGHNLCLDYGCGGVMVCSFEGSRMESPRLTKAGALEWLRAYMQALDNATDSRFSKEVRP